MKGLTDKQKNIIEFINDFMETAEMAPTIYEIAEHFHIKTSTVFAHIRALQKKSCLTRSSKARSISLAKPRRRVRMPNGVQPIPFIEAKAEGGKAAPRDFFLDLSALPESTRHEDLMAMRVSGSNLRNQGILEGDIVIIRSNPINIETGEIVLTEQNGQNVLSVCRPLDSEHLEISGDHSNAAWTVHKSDLPLKGVVVGLQRRISR